MENTQWTTAHRGSTPLDKIARRGFRTNLASAGRWKSKWHARLVGATLTETA